MSVKVGRDVSRIFYFSKVVFPLNIGTISKKLQFRNLSVGHIAKNSSAAKAGLLVKEQENIPLEVDEEEPLPIFPWDSNTQSSDCNKSDKIFFKGLKNTSTSHWLENAKEVVDRFNWKKLLENQHTFKEELKRRQSEVDVDKICQLWSKLQNMKQDSQSKEINDLEKEIVKRAIFIPNFSHPESLNCSEEEPKVIYTNGQPRSSKGVVPFQDFCVKRDYLRSGNLGNFAMSKSYVFLGPLAELAQALVRFSVEGVKSEGFQVISVPDTLVPHVIESCGFPTRGTRDQVFWVEHPDYPEKELCLSGTAEMGISSILENKVFQEAELPLKLAAVTRCYRAETSNMEEEKGIYRVHAFTKVEMFGVTANETGEESNDMHMKFKEIQENLFSKLNLHFRTLEMPPVELGSSAHRKFDIEAWMPGREMFGEISSCSNCTDFQSRRLNIRYLPNNSSGLKYVHTVNGTACAVPRMLISIVETFQSGNTVQLPSALKPYLIRSWEDSAAATRSYRSIFLRTKAQQEKATQSFREW